MTSFRLFTAQEKTELQISSVWLEKWVPSSLQALLASQKRLQRLGELLTEYPSLSLESSEHSLSQNARNLVQTLCTLNPLEMKLKMPSKGLLADTYLMAKAQHFKEWVEALRACPKAPEIEEKLSFFSLQIEQIIHTYLLGQLLIDVILDAKVQESTKRDAAKNLLSLWDQFSNYHSLSGFFPTIRSLWDARLQIQVQFGTLLGTIELLQLVESECSPAILDFFTSHELTEEESWAFQEFLFGLLYEDLVFVRKKMDRLQLPVVQKEQIHEWLSLPDKQISERLQFEKDPHFIYRSYKQRRFRCRYRLNTNSKGPQKTAEEFLVLMLLQKNKKCEQSL